MEFMDAGRNSAASGFNDGVGGIGVAMERLVPVDVYTKLEGVGAMEDAVV